MNNKLFVGNISWGVDSEALREVFAQYGEIEKAIVVTDRETGRSKGIGFVTFVNEEDAVSAMEALNEYELDGRPIKVDKALPPKPREDGYNRA